MSDTLTSHLVSSRSSILGYTPAGNVNESCNLPLLCLGSQYGVAGRGNEAPLRRLRFFPPSLSESKAKGKEDEEELKEERTGAGARKGMTLILLFVYGHVPEARLADCY
uniref:Serine--tRNA ligase n=1 Tax=Lygus hesperus TaxID=30085 RepID=A0A0A9VXQ0_LYGHE